MKAVVFGLSVSSSWGNGHATLWRGLCRSLAARGHDLVFFERDQPYYASHRDLTELPGGGLLVLYSDWPTIAPIARAHLAEADVGIVTSYCPDGPLAAELVLDSSVQVHAFYDLDTPVTLEQLRRGEPVAYWPARGLSDFDLVLSFTGGRALDALRNEFGARLVLPLYGSVDPDLYRPVPGRPHYAADLSYLGTYAADRQEALVSLLIEPARCRPSQRFVIGGAQYPGDFPWSENIWFVRHLPPSEHPAFYCSSRLTLNVTRGAMLAMGFCPSGRLFEAAACATPMLSDWWEGLDQFFTPEEEIWVVRSTDDVVAALDRDSGEAARVGRAARERALSCHTAEQRAIELEAALESSLRVGA